MHALHVIKNLVSRGRAVPRRDAPYAAAATATALRIDFIYSVPFQHSVNKIDNRINNTTKKVARGSGKRRGRRARQQ